MSATRNRGNKRALGMFLSMALLAFQPVEGETRTESLKHAAALIAEGHTAAAEEPLRALLKQDPSDAVALNLLGLIRIRERQPVEAEALFLRAIQTGREIAGPHLNLARLYAADRPIDAIAHLQRALELVPADPPALALLRSIAQSAALASRRPDKRQSALDVLAKAEAVLPQDPEILYDKGMLALEAGDSRAAAASFEKALQAVPEYPEARYGLARAYLEQNMAASAEAEMRRYLQTRPDDATARYGLGYILMTEQRPDAAQAEFDRSLSMEPAQTESLFQLGEIALQKSRNDVAQQEFAKVLARDPHHAGALTGLGILAFRAANFPDARSFCEQAIAAAPLYQKAHYYYALTLSRLGEKAEAEREFGLARTLQKPHMGGVSGTNQNP